jgi:hypothetical protein
MERLGLILPRVLAGLERQRDGIEGSALAPRVHEPKGAGSRGGKATGSTGGHQGDLHELSLDAVTPIRPADPHQSRGSAAPVRGRVRA